MHGRITGVAAQRLRAAEQQSSMERPRKNKAKAGRERQVKTQERGVDVQILRWCETAESRRS